METVELIFTYTQREYVEAAREYLLANKTMRKFDKYISDYRINTGSDILEENRGKS